MASNQLKGQNANTPQIQPIIIILLKCNLGANIIRGSTISPPLLLPMRDMYRPAKISELNVIIDRKQYILGLDIPVYDFKRMQVGDSLNHLVDVLGCPLLLKARLLLQDLVELTLGGVVQDDVDLLLVVEEAVHLQDVSVAEVAVDLDLTTQLEDYVVLLQLLLGQHL